MTQAAQFLIAHGHNERAVLYEYGFDKLFAYYRAGLEDERRRLTEQALAMRAAVNGNAKQFDAFLKQLGPSGKDRQETGEPDPPAKIRGLMKVLKNG